MIRNKNIDGLKVICAFLAVCIHIPFRITGGGVLHSDRMNLVKEKI